MNLPAEGAPRKRGQVRDCIDCGRPVYRYCTRCKACQSRLLVKRVALACAHCLAPLSLVPAVAAAFREHFCGRACKQAHQLARRPSALCAECGATVSRPPSQIIGRRRVFCSSACRLTHLRRERHHLENVKPQRIACPCAQCGTIVHRKPSHVARVAAVFCTQACSAEAQRGRPVERRGASRPCAQCGATFYRPPCRDRIGRRYCSNKCAALGRRKPSIHLTRTCQTCGAMYRTTLHQVTKRGSRYCSRACHYAGKRTGTTVYNFYWRSTAAKVRRRDNYTCQLCERVQKTPRLHVHHIIPAATFGIDRATEANDPRNLVSLCAPCHRRAESNPSLLADSPAWQLTLPLCG